MDYSLRMLVKGVVERDSKNDIRKYLSARSELEKAANSAHDMLWKNFVESTGYEPLRHPNPI